MQEIILQEIIIKNYRSYKDATFTFPLTAGLRMLSGENKLTPRLGSNGSGKSSFWDAVEWCFHGTSVQGSKISDSLTWGATTASVVTKLFIGGQLNVINRYGPPVKIELNGTLVEQTEIDKLLGLSKLRFLHSVIFGQDQRLFPDLTVPERGTLLDDVLGLAIWQKATDVAGSKHTELEKQLLKKKSDISFLTGKATSLPSNAQIETDIKQWEQDKENQLIFIRSNSLTWLQQGTSLIENLEKQKEEWKTKLLEQIEAKALEIENLEAELAPIKFKVETELANPFGVQISILEQQLKEAQTQRSQYSLEQNKAQFNFESCVEAEKLWNNDICPACKEPITADKKKHELACLQTAQVKCREQQKEAFRMLKEVDAIIADRNNQLKELSAITIEEKTKLEGSKKEVSRIEVAVTNVERQARILIEQFDSPENPYETQITTLRARQNPYTQQEQDLLTKVNPFTAKLAELTKERAKVEDELVELQCQYNLIESSMTAAEYWKHGFKRIRLFFIQHILAALEIEIQSAVSSLGLEQWQIKLATESETKSGSTKLGIQIHVKSPEAEAQWNSWCGGEKQRLRLAIAMGLSSLIQRASGCFWNLEVWDEPTRALSPQGVDDLLEALRYRAGSSKKQLWLTDHSSIQYSGFEEVWIAVKEQTGSIIVKSS